MKKKLESLYPVFGLLCIPALLVGVLFVAPIIPSGCVQYVPPTMSQGATDQVILRAEQTAQTARLTFDTLVHVERDNEALLKQVNPNIHVYANTIRAHGLDWVTSLRDATKTFKANRTPQNQATLNTWIITLTNSISEANKYIAVAKKAAQP